MQSIITRRRMLQMSAGAGLAALTAPRAFALGEATLGSRTVTMISDGTLTLPLSFIYPNVPAEEIKAFLAAHGITGEALTPDCNVTLVRDGERAILFDVGSGHNFMPTAGKLVDNLAEAGVELSDITDVVFTHGHPDHLWGLLDEFDEPLFPDANYHMNRIEWEYWRAGDTLDKTPEERKSFVVGAQARLAALEDRINLFDYGAEVLPGVEAVDTRGHTQGHTSFMVHDGSESLLVVGDALSQAAISFEKPEWPSGSDHEPDVGAATRLKLLDRLAADKSAIVGYHLPHPGLGRVEKAGTAWKFVAG